MAHIAPPPASPYSDRRTQFLLAGVILIVLVRGAVAAFTPISYDEAYYWTWSKHLSSGYLDHPPLIAFVIRLGTIFFGDTSAGVRLVSWLLSLAASWAVWRAGALILESESGGALAALFFNLMPMIGVESLVATPDAPEIAAAAFLLWALALIAKTGRGSWWLAAGLAAGVALLSKYTAFFLGVGIVLWLFLARKERKWFFSFWPYLAAAISLAMFSPVVAWNAQHEWMSFAKQFGRVGEGGGFTLKFLGEFLAGQLILATPFFAIFGVAGLVAILKRPAAMRSEMVLLGAIILPSALYFLWHSLQDRVQGNWPSFLYPAFAILAALAYSKAGNIDASGFLRISRRLALPVAASMMALLYAQALWGIIPRVRDPVSRLLAEGMNPVTDEIERLRAQAGASVVLTTSYSLTGWMAFYLPTHPPVIQFNERDRYVNEPEPARALFEGALLYVTEMRNDQSPLLAARYSQITLLSRIARTRNGATIDQYMVYSVSGLKGEPLDQGR